MLLSFCCISRSLSLGDRGCNFCRKVSLGMNDCAAAPVGFEDFEGLGVGAAIVLASTEYSVYSQGERMRLTKLVMIC